MIRVKRVYEALLPEDGALFLVDRLWPRGVTKDKLAAAVWLKAVAPTRPLRAWFHHEPERWEEFQRRYAAELDAHPEHWQVIV